MDSLVILSGKIISDGIISAPFATHICSDFLLKLKEEKFRLMHKFCCTIFFDSCFLIFYSFFFNLMRGMGVKKRQTHTTHSPSDF